MSIVMNNNIASLIAQKNLAKNTSDLSTIMQRLSSGYKINKASDDAAGLAISECLQGQINGNSQALSNTQTDINVLQVADGGLSIINSNMQRIRELTVQASNGTNGSSEKTAILAEIKTRLSDIDRISKSTTFNNLNLLNGNITGNKLQIGSGSAVSTNSISLSSVLVNNSVSSFDMQLTGITSANWDSSKIGSYLTTIDAALSRLSSNRSNIGALQNRLQNTVSNLSVMNQNLQSTQSGIRDTDIAQETSDYTRVQILQQASATILTQANNMTQIGLTLLKGG